MATKTNAANSSQRKPASKTDPGKEPTVRILKVGTCPSLTGASTLTYHVGYDTELRFRVWGNTGGGLFGKEWVAWSTILPALQSEKLTAGTLRALFRGKSRNTPGFLLAALKAEGLVTALAKQGYTGGDSSEFLKAMEKLIASGTDLPEAPGKP